MNDSTGLPLRRGHVTLRPAKAGVTAIGADSDDKGEFVLRGIEPGNYSLIATRDGYLANSVCLKGGVRMPPVISIEANQSITSLTCRLRPSAVIAGKIRFDDGEPATSIRVIAYREFRYRGRHAYSGAGNAITDDRGEYRMHSLAPGSYTIAALYERAAPTPGYKEQRRTDAQGREVPVLSYTTTFYPNTTKLSEAVPVRLEYGKEVSGVDVFLGLVRKVKIHGQVTSGISGEAVASASLFLQRVDAHNTGSIPVPVAASFDTNKRFEIKDVAPGSYMLWAEGADEGHRLTGRAYLTVSSADIDNADIIIAPERVWPFTIRVEGGGQLDQQKSLRIRLEPRSERGASADSREDRDSLFRVSVMGDETYDLFIQNLSEDFYISQVRVNGADVLAHGLEGSIASPTRPFEVVVDSRGGKVSGIVAGPDGTAWSGATLELIPDPTAGRLQAYREGYANENGQFLIRGVAPGKYILTAWLDDAPCDYWDPDALDGCRAAGMKVEVQQSDTENVMLVMKASASR